MSLDNFPNLSLATASPINSTNRRQRSNTSPSQSICPPKVLSINHQSSLTHQTSLTNRSQALAQDYKQEEEKPEHKKKHSNNISLDNTNLCSLSSRSSFKSSLKREAHSPVYLDQNTILLASSNDNFKFTSSDNSNYLTRRVVQCNSSRIRSSDSDVTSISSQDENVNLNRRPTNSGREIIGVKNKRRSHGQRNKWTQEETEALVRGCNTFAIGQWKAIRDSEPLLSKRSPGDLKDRFRTYFPDAYRQHYPNAKTHISSRVRSVDSNGNSLFGENAIRRERKQFSAEEDAALKRGYLQFGTAWSSIQRDPILASRKATDLRDRFRNAFPDLYAAAGYKPRSRKASGSNAYDLSPTPYQQHGTFEAIDLSVYPPYPSRTTVSHLHPDHYQLPSLDFLKAHGANAFSDFRMMMSSRQMPVGDDVFPFDNSHSAAVTMSPAIPSHLTNITPRPNITTPRPNDTTPRPRTMLTTLSSGEHDSAAIGSNESAFEPLVPSSTKPLKSLHKTQSSMDLNRFSNFLWADSSCNHLTADDDIRASISGSAFTDYLDYGTRPSVSHCDNEFFQKQSPAAETSLSLASSNLGEGGVKLDTSDSPIIPNLEPDFNMLKNINNTTDWLQELEIASQTFPGAFDISCFTSDQILESQDGGSCDSSLISGEPPMDPIDDRVIYTGDGMTSEGKPQPQSQSFFIPSAHVHEFLPNSQFIESHNQTLVSESLKDIGHHSEIANAVHQSPHLLSRGYEKNQSDSRNTDHLNQVTLCPPLNLPSGLNPSSSCSPLSPISSSPSMYSSSSTSTSSLSLLSSSPTQSRSNFTNI